METRTTGIFSELIYIRKHRHFGALDCALGDRHPDDPKGVPWDQNFCVKIFVALTYNDVIYAFCEVVIETHS